MPANFEQHWNAVYRFLPVFQSAKARSDGTELTIAREMVPGCRNIPGFELIGPRVLMRDYLDDLIEADRLGYPAARQNARARQDQLGAHPHAAAAPPQSVPPLGQYGAFQLPGYGDNPRPALHAGPVAYPLPPAAHAPHAGAGRYPGPPPYYQQYSPQQQYPAPHPPQAQPVPGPAAVPRHAPVNLPRFRDAFSEYVPGAVPDPRQVHPGMGPAAALRGMGPAAPAAGPAGQQQQAPPGANSYARQSPGPDQGPGLGRR